MTARLLRRLWNLTRLRQLDSDLKEELASHQAMKQEEFERHGLSTADAARQSARALGPTGLAREDARAVWISRWLDDVARDVIYSLRGLGRNPGFTFVVVAMLALGIGANTAIFSLLNAVLIRTLPVESPKELVEVGRTGGRTLSYPMFEVVRDNNQVFSDVFAISSGRWTASARLGTLDAGDVRVSPVSSGYFETLRITPALGRGFIGEDVTAGNRVVISFQWWKRTLSGDPEVLGKTLSLGGRPHTIIGIAPDGFTGVAMGQPVDLWVPVTWIDGQTLHNREALILRIVGRLKPGTSLDQAQANMTLVSGQWSKEWGFPQATRVGVASASGGLTQLRRLFSRPLSVLMTIVVLLLVTSSVNVANLLLARASARHREIGVRLSLGADRWRLIKQSLTESCVLGIMGGAVGLLLAPAVGAFLVRFLSTAVGPIELAYTLDTSVLAFVAATSCVVVLLFGLGPAIAATRLDPSSLFRGITIGRHHQGSLRPRSLLVTVQVAIACVLLVGALLFARSLQALTSLDAGFEPANVLILQARLASATPTGAERIRRYGRIAQRLASVPGVRSTALSSENLFSGNTWTESVRVPNFTPPAGDNSEAVLLVISPGFFTTMNTPLLRGRDFDARETDQSQGVAIVNQAMARYYFGATDVVGRTFRLATSDFADPLTVVGVVDNAKYKSLREPTPRIVYLPDQQVPGPMEGATNIAVRTIGDPEQMQEVLWKEARRADADLRQAGTVTQARLVNATIAQDLMLAQLSGVFGLTAALLTCLGLYGLTSYEVSRRTAEIGLRIALGAQPADIRQSVLRGVLALIGAGLAVGLGVALGLGRLVESLLFGVRSTDLVTLLLATVLLLCVGAGAAYLPARRAMTLDPMVALRCE